LVFIGFLALGITEFNATTDERIRELSAKLLERRIRASSWALAEQLRIAVDTYVREHTRHVPAIKETAVR